MSLRKRKGQVHCRYCTDAGQGTKDAKEIGARDWFVTQSRREKISRIGNQGYGAGNSSLWVAER